MIDEIDCKAAMMIEVFIDRDVSKEGKLKSFGFHVWDGEYKIRHNTKVVGSGRDLDNLLNYYNQL